MVSRGQPRGPFIFSFQFLHLSGLLQRTLGSVPGDGLSVTAPVPCRWHTWTFLCDLGTGSTGSCCGKAGTGHWEEGGVPVVGEARTSQDPQRVHSPTVITPPVLLYIGIVPSGER